MIIKKILACGGIAMVISTASACTASPAPTSEPPIGAIPVVRSDSDIVLPIDAYRLSADKIRAFTVAVDILGRACMNRFGLYWPPNSPTPGPPAAQNARRYSITDPDKAKIEGYHHLDAEKRGKDIAARQAKQKQPTSDAVNVWGGTGEQTFGGQPVPAGGCAGEATRQLDKGAPKADPGIAERLQLDTYQQMAHDSRVAHAVGEWRKCMTAAGFDYPDPSAAGADRRWQTAQPSKAEITVATADAACKTQAKVAGTMLAVETAYQQRAMAKHPTEMAAIKQLLETQFANATQVAATRG
ncbi:hypothetical protein [Actinoplanes sp. NPDC026619]|uniref:hypothetical protein n=1 Tax=Actinoplanes sp. NPDC026619 TaxID=3155798 RepID=UPI0033EA4C3E